MDNFKSTIIENKRYSFFRDEKDYAHKSIATVKSEIENDITSRELYFRTGTLADIKKISAFQREMFYPHTETLESEYELYRILKFGYALIIESSAKELLGCYTTVHYETCNDKVGFGVRVSVSSSISGQNLAARLANYAVALALESGCNCFKALMNPCNLRSASNVLNHVGYYCTNFYEDLPSFGARFEISLPLSPETLNNREIDIEKIIHFIKKHTVNEHYLLIEPENIDRIKHTYSFTDFRIIAF